LIIARREMAENKEVEDQVEDETPVTTTTTTTGTKTNGDALPPDDEKPAETANSNGDEKKNGDGDTTNGSTTEEANGDAEEKKEEKKEEEGGDVKEEGEGKDEEEEESSDEEELPPGLLEKPLIVETKRERKSVDRNVDRELTKKEYLDYTRGSGVPLGDIPVIRINIDQSDTEDLHVLHRIMYRTPGKKMSTKRDLRNFCGFPFERDTKEFINIKSNLIDRLLRPALKWTLRFLCLEQGGEMEEMRDRLCTYLLKPHMIEEAPNQPKEKPKKKSKSKPKKKTSVNGEEGEVSDVSDASDDDSSSDNEDEEKTKKKKATPKQQKKKGGAVKISIGTKKPKSATKNKRKGSDDSSEDDEPLAKKSKSPPTNAELKKVVAAILKDADLETVTMKTVVRDVYARYSSFDLTARKEFIKDTVKELIS